jgi:hypothetical protein
VLYDFLGTIQPGNSTDGADPEGRLAQGADGAIYGTTTFGGTPSGYGTAWSLKLTNGKWVYKRLRRFAADSHFNDANTPHAGLVIDTNSVLYGAGAGGRRLSGRRGLSIDSAREGRRAIGLQDADELQTTEYQRRRSLRAPLIAESSLVWREHLRRRFHPGLQ